MPEHLLDDLDVGSSGDGEARRGVAELMRMQPGDADRMSRLIESRPERADPKRLPTANAGEHERVQRLAGEVLAELSDQERRDRHLAPLVVLRCAPDQAVPLHGCHRRDDRGAVAGEVDPVDAQSGHLTEADTGVGEEQHDESVGLVVAGVEVGVLVRVAGVAALGGEVIDLVVGEVKVLALRDAREVDAGGDVAREAPVLHGEVEDEAQDPVDLLHAGR